MNNNVELLLNNHLRLQIINKNNHVHQLVEDNNINKYLHNNVIEQIRNENFKTNKVISFY